MAIIKTTTTERKKVFFIGLWIILFFTGLGLFSTYIIKSRALGVFSLLVILSSIVLMLVLLKRFTYDVVFELGANFISVQVDKNEFLVDNYLLMEDIAYYNINVPNDRWFEIKFILKDGRKFEYSIPQKDNKKQIEHSETLIEYFSNYFKEYNKLKETKRIEFKPAFFATKKGLIFIIGITIFLFFGYALWFTYARNTSPSSFLCATLLILQLLSKRQKEMEIYRKWNK